MTRPNRSNPASAIRSATLRGALLAGATMLVLGGSVVVALAEDQPTSAADPCRAQPNMAGKAAPGGDIGSPRPSLGECNGVLKPPATADHELVEPAPKTGSTLVVPRSNLPAQQP